MLWRYLVQLMVFHFCFIAGMLAKAAVTNLSTDESALLELKSHLTLQPNNFLFKNWSSSFSVCNWVGISCGTRHKRVTALNLTNMGLQGTIPPHLGNLSFLKSITIDGNSFHGLVPRELIRLRRLETIIVNDNNLSGDVSPWLANLTTSVQVLSLQNNSFFGAIPMEIDNLVSLRILNLQYNQISGKIPYSIFNMSSLEVIALTFNNLSGILPDDIGYRLPKLEVLFLSSNRLKGKIPATVGELSNLWGLSLSLNRFTGIIPTTLGNLTQLKTLFLGSNYLTDKSYLRIGMMTGSIPYELSHLQDLEDLGVSDNNLSGLVPPAIFNLSSLTLFDLSKNQLSGHLPSNIAFPNLQYFSLANNSLSGRIPSSISNSSNLIVLYIFNNSFSGPIPNTLGNLRMLQRLDITLNNLTADLSSLSSLTTCMYLDTLSLSLNPLNTALPISIGNMSSLQYFIAAFCNIRGSMPVQIGNVNTIIQMELPGNELTGSIPSTLGRLKQLQGLGLSGNKLEGAIPSDICNLQNLNYLKLDGNRLSGRIPTCFPNLTSLRNLYLQNNNLNSTIPSSFWSLTFLLELNLRSNSVNGTLPFDIGNLKVLTLMDLSRNQISGAIPSSIGSLRDLQYLSLAENNLQGPIPQSFGNMVSLISLNLSANNLSGMIPKSLEAISNLKSINLSSNRLQGEIPTGGPFRNFSAESFKSNNALCGSPRFQVPPCQITTPGKSNSLLKYILPAIGLVLLVIAFITIFIKRQKNSKSSIEGNNHLPLEPWRRISFYELQQATDGFNEYNLLGTGSFGSVYKGSLSDGTNIAVKVFNMQKEGISKSFDTECEVMRNIRHRNLVKIISTCSNIDFKALILEYMPNGSLEKWLYSYSHFLDTLQRLNIMIDVASAIEYLHYHSPTILHCDLKPNNILLDEEMVAHVGDFGIAKLLGAENSMTQTLTLATIGYMAPEYGLAGIVSTSGDVYSFGILLMETFTRKKPTDEMFSQDMSMKQWVKSSFPDAVTEIVDSNLLAVEQEESLNAEMNCALSLFRLALDCCAELTEERRNMKDVVSNLQKIKTQFLKDLQQVNQESASTV